MGDLLAWLKSFFVGLWEKLCSWVYEFFKFLESFIQLFISLWQYILDFFAKFFIWIWNLLVSIWDKISLVVFGFLESSLDSVISVFPDFSSYFQSLSVLKPYLYLATDWFALDVAVVLLGMYLAYIPVMILVKLIIKLFVPTVG